MTAFYCLVAIKNATIDTAAGESAIQSNITWGIANYTDATARQYLIDTAVPLNIPAAFVKLEISQLSMSWLKACAL
jgi:hypothetical protein